MKLTLPSWRTIWKRPAPSLAGLLEISWWAVLGLFVVLLALDGAAFYRFGLGRVSGPLPGETGEPASILVRENTLRGAAAKIEERLARFNAAATSSAGIPNPFR